MHVDGAGWDMKYLPPAYSVRGHALLVLDRSHRTVHPFSRPLSNLSKENFSTAAALAAWRIARACDGERENASCITDAKSSAVFA